VTLGYGVMQHQRRRIQPIGRARTSVALLPLVDDLLQKAPA